LSNITDWLSAASSAGTLIVAFMAYKAVPKLIHQKADEISYILANQLICELYPQMIEDINNLSLPFRYLPSKDFADLVPLSKQQHIDLVEHLERNEDLIWKFYEKERLLCNNIRRLSRYGWNLQPKQKELNNIFLNEIQYFCSVYISCNTKAKMLLWPDREKYDDSDEYNEHVKYFNDEIYESHDMLILKSDLLTKYINDFLDSTTRVDDFFTRNTK